MVGRWGLTMRRPAAERAADGRGRARVGHRLVQESMNLKYEPASKPLHISIKWLFLNCGCPNPRRTCRSRSWRGSCWAPFAPTASGAPSTRTFWRSRTPRTPSESFSWLKRRRMAPSSASVHPGVELRENLKSISHRCFLFEIAFVWELTK